MRQFLKISFCLLNLFLLPGSVLSGAMPLDEFDYLPAGLKVDERIPTPEKHLGFRVGERHVQHHQLVSYFRQLARISPRFKLKVYAYTHGAKPCILLTITSEENHRKLDEIREAHVRLTRPTQASDVDLKKLPAVINMGYSVHGDESSASNAALMVGYYLAAGQDRQVESILEHCVILLDPCLNPDGLDRFASWANGHVGRIQNADPNHAEHNQPFPGGRVNYYWFDLNRDWLPAQHPESQGRLRQYHWWKPNVVLDFHEMGTNSTYFFQPGIPARNNPLTPARNYQLTEEMGEYHARALDKIGSLYMTEERFDDFYMGKGSTYPDLHGSVGILFEQASSRGHRQESTNGELTFPFTIRNQVTTSLSSLNATVALREKLLAFKKDFYRESLEEANQLGSSHFEFRCKHDRSRLMSFAEVLLRHDIQVQQMMDDGEPVLVVPVRQPEFRFLVSLTEKRTEFRENIFYDVSTWHLPSAFGVEADLRNQPVDGTKLKRLTLNSLDKSETDNQLIRRKQTPLAWLVDWRSQESARLLARLLKEGIQVRVAGQEFSIDSDNGKLEFPHGTIMVPLGIQPDKSVLLTDLLSDSAAPVYPVRSGLTPTGIDLGSGLFQAVKPAQVAMLIGEGVSRYEAGEVWHLFDTRLESPLTMIDTSQLAGTNLSRYTSLVLVSGSYSSLTDRGVARIKSWVEGGGNLVLCGTAISWARDRKLVGVTLLDTNGGPLSAPESTERELEERPTSLKDSIQKPFDQARNDAALKLISGAIFETSVDRTHPLGYGYTGSTVPVFRNNRVIVKPSTDPYSNALVYTDSPQVAGYCSRENVEQLKNSAAAYSTTLGNGTVVVIPQNPNFRAFWYGTTKLFVNAVFFGDLTKK